MAFTLFWLIYSTAAKVHQLIIDRENLYNNFRFRSRLAYRTLLGDSFQFNIMNSRYSAVQISISFHQWRILHEVDVYLLVFAYFLYGRNSFLVNKENKCFVRVNEHVYEYKQVFGSIFAFSHTSFPLDLITMCWQKKYPKIRK